MANGSAMATGHYLGDTGTFSNTIYTGLPGRARQRHRGALPRGRPGSARRRRAFRRRLPERRNHPEDGARPRASAPRRSASSGPTLLFDHTDKTGADGLHSIVIDDATGGKNGVPLSQEMKAALDQGRSSTRNAAARRQRQGRRRQDAGHHVRQRRAAGLHGRCRHQGGAADVQGAQQAVRAGVLVARSRRQPAQYRRQPQHASRPASTARPRSPASRMPTTTSRSCARRSTNSASPPRPTS